MGRGLVALLGLLSLWPAAVLAQASNCQALAQQGAPLVHLASLGAPLAEAVRIRYLTHAEFALQTPAGVVAVTDYNGLLGDPDLVPDVVTMNHAHESHYTDAPDPRIPMVLKGWPMAGRPAYFDIQIKDLHIRNVTSDTRGPFGEGAEQDGNSIFLFEVAGLCIAHLGHLHQLLGPVQLASIGRVDVVMLPIDGGYTMDQDAMIAVARGLHAQVILPMHWFSAASLEEFLGRIAVDYAVDDALGPEVALSAATLPDRPTVILLHPSLVP